MILTLPVAEKLRELLHRKSLPEGQFRHPIVAELIEEGILTYIIKGRTRKVLYLRNEEGLKQYLYHQYGILDLELYINTIQKESLSRADLVTVARNSKAKAVRTFKGFLANSYDPLHVSLNGKALALDPVEGTFTFISDYETFQIPPERTIIGVENPENFRQIARQRYLFPDIQPLFVSRYPQSQSKDLIRWLQSVPNNYLHFGDFDFAGIHIYLSEFHKHLGEKASFFIPPAIEELLLRYGNGNLYDLQYKRYPFPANIAPELRDLLDLLGRHKKGLEQESLIQSPSPR